MSTKPNDSVSKGQPSGDTGGSSSQSRANGGGRGSRGGPNRGGPRGRGRGRTPSISGISDIPSTSPIASPASEKPSLLSRLNLVPVPSPSSPTSTASKASPISPDVTSPKTASARSQRRRKSSNATPLAVNVIPSSPLATKAPGSQTPLSAKGKSPLSQSVASETPSLPSVTEAPIPKPDIMNELEAPKDNLNALSPMASPRPFTPMGRDWAADDDDGDNGSLPSLDDWGLPGIKAASDQGDIASKSRLPNSASLGTPSGTALTAASLARLSLSTDVSARNRRAGSAPPSAVSPTGGLPAFASIIPPTPVIPGPNASQGRSIKGVATGLNRLPSISGEPNQTPGEGSGLLNRAGRSFSRPNSPLPLNLVARRDSISSARSQSTGRPTSGGVALGISSRPGSPAPGIDFARSRPGSPAFVVSRPGSPALSGFMGSRPSSPAPKSGGGGLSGGVSLGVSRPSSPNPDGLRSHSPRPPIRMRSSTLSPPADWGRPSPSSDQLSHAQQDSPLSPPLPLVTQSPISPPPSIPPIQTSPPPGGSLAARLSDPPPAIPPFRGGGHRGMGGMHGRGNFRGAFGRGSGFAGGRGGSPLQNPLSPDQSSPVDRVPGGGSPTVSRGRGSPFGRSSAAASRGDQDASQSPTNQSPGSPVGRASRGHARSGSNSRPVISSLAISQLGASLGSPKKSKPSPVKI